DYYFIIWHNNAWVF
nr:immunoglobulin light chain junction region [Macaca mulatta]